MKGLLSCCALFAIAVASNLSYAAQIEAHVIPNHFAYESILEETSVLGMKLRSWRLAVDIETAFSGLAELPCLKQGLVREDNVIRMDCLLTDRLVSVESHPLGVLWSESKPQTHDVSAADGNRFVVASFGPYVIEQSIVSGPLMHVFRKELQQARKLEVYQSHQVFRGAFLITTRGETSVIIHGWQRDAGNVHVTRVQEASL